MYEYSCRHSESLVQICNTFVEIQNFLLVDRFYWRTLYVCVCLSARAVKGKRFKLSKLNSAVIQSTAVARHAMILKSKSSEIKITRRLSDALSADSTSARRYDCSGFPAQFDRGTLTVDDDVRRLLWRVQGRRAGDVDSRRDAGATARPVDRHHHRRRRPRAPGVAGKHVTYRRSLKIAYSNVGRARHVSTRAAPTVPASNSRAR